jgi:hypothetical protein
MGPATLRIEESRNICVLLASSASFAAVDPYVGRTNFKELKSQGLRPFAVGAIGEVPIAVVTLAMVLSGRSQSFLTLTARGFHTDALGRQSLSRRVVATMPGAGSQDEAGVFFAARLRGRI